MNKLRNILVPIDFSQTSRLLLAQGTRMAAWHNATLHVLHAIDHSSVKHYEATHGELDWSRLEGQARRLMDEAVRLDEATTIPVQSSIVQGHPAECILQRAEEVNADLIILSAHDIGHKRLGRVATDVVRNASCKVLIARDWHPSNFLRIAACIDFSDLSAEVLQQAIHVAKQDGAALELIHVIYPLDRDFDIYKIDFGTQSKADYKERVQTALQKNVEEFVAPFRRELDELEFKVATLESTDPAIAITSHVQSSQIDLVVLGTTGHESVFGLRFGSNAEHLIQDTSCSVLSIKPPGKP